MPIRHGIVETARFSLQFLGTILPARWLNRSGPMAFRQLLVVVGGVPICTAAYHDRDIKMHDRVKSGHVR